MKARSLQMLPHASYVDARLASLEHGIIFHLRIARGWIPARFA